MALAETGIESKSAHQEANDRLNGEMRDFSHSMANSTFCHHECCAIINLCRVICAQHAVGLSSRIFTFRSNPLHFVYVLICVNCVIYGNGNLTAHCTIGALHEMLRHRRDRVNRPLYRLYANRQRVVLPA